MMILNLFETYLNVVLHTIRIAMISHNSMNTEMCEPKNIEKEVWLEHENRTALADHMLLSLLQSYRFFEFFILWIYIVLFPHLREQL